MNGWALRHRCEYQPCAPGKEIKSELAYLNFCDLPTDSYQLYTEMAAKHMNAQESDGVFSGWNAPTYRQEEEGRCVLYSWSSQPDFTKSIVLPLPTGAGLEYIQIEDEWQQSIGSNAVHPQRFPEGMKSVVDKIHAKGLRAGIRFDPYSVAVGSNLVKDHPEYFLKDRNDKPATLALEDGMTVALL